MNSVRNPLELPSPSYAGGTVYFVGSRMRPMAAAPSSPYQDATLGNITTVTTTYQMLPSDGLVLAGNTTSYTVTLPTAVGLKGVTVRIKKTGASGTLTIDGSGTETIDGALTVTTSTQYDLIELVSDGANWQRVNLAGTAAQAADTVANISATGSVTSTQTTVVLSGTSTYNLALPLPSAVTGLTFRFKKTGASGVVTLTTPGAETIDGAASLDITAQYRAVALLSDGTNWHLMYDSTPTAG
jgi:hypothetical protein